MPRFFEFADGQGELFSRPQLHFGLSLTGLRFAAVYFERESEATCGEKVCFPVLNLPYLFGFGTQDGISAAVLEILASIEDFAFSLGIEMDIDVHSLAVGHSRGHCRTIRRADDFDIRHADIVPVF